MKLLSQVNQQLDFYLSPINLEIARSGIANQAPPRTSAGYTGAHSERKTAACVRRKRRGERWRCRSAPLFPDPSSLPPAEKEHAMHIGVCMFNTDYAIRIEELARAAEERGFESLFLPEHTHIPASRRTPFPRGCGLPREYSHTLDPFVALAYAAAVTTRLRLGTGICLIIERDTIITAKEVASVDFVSKGRFLFGIGGGWNVEEMENHGTDPKTRFKRLREQGRAMKGIWTGEAAAFHGEHVRFDPIWMRPKPVQKPHPPVLLG